MPRRYAMIHDLAVRRDRGAGAVELIVWEFNAQAIAFYERLGYATLSRKMAMSL